MKKLFAMILVLILLPVVALTESNPLAMMDLSAVSDEVLKSMIALCSQELMARHVSEPEGILLFEYENAKLYQTGDPYISSGFLRIPVAVYNDNDYGITFGINNAVCNGWDIYSNGCGASANAKNKGTLTFSVDDADVTDMDQIDSLRFSWTVTNSETFRFIYKQEESEEHRFW